MFKHKSLLITAKERLKSKRLIFLTELSQTIMSSEISETRDDRIFILLQSMGKYHEDDFAVFLNGCIDMIN